MSSTAIFGAIINVVVHSIWVWHSNEADREIDRSIGPTHNDPESDELPQKYINCHLQLIGTIFQKTWTYHYICIPAIPPSL
jgi:hypothetical protein